MGNRKRAFTAITLVIIVVLIAIAFVGTNKFKNLGVFGSKNKKEINIDRVNIRFSDYVRIDQLGKIDSIDIISGNTTYYIKSYQEEKIIDGNKFMIDMPEIEKLSINGESSDDNKIDTARLLKYLIPEKKAVIKFDAQNKIQELCIDGITDEDIEGYKESVDQEFKKYSQQFLLITTDRDENSNGKYEVTFTYDFPSRPDMLIGIKAGDHKYEYDELLPTQSGFVKKKDNSSVDSSHMKDYTAVLDLRTKGEVTVSFNNETDYDYFTYILYTFGNEYYKTYTNRQDHEFYKQYLYLKSIFKN